MPTLISELSQTAGSNFPGGSESPTTADDYFRAHASFLAQLRDGSGYSAEVSVASAATCDIGAAASMFIQVTGTTAVTSFGTTYSGPRFLRFAGSLTLTHNASSLVLPGGANIVTAAGDTCIVVPQSAGWRVVSYERDNGGSSLGAPVGEIKMFAGTTTPTGYLMCNGAAVSRTTYAALYAVIGATYGAGDGSTTFNLPDFRDRMPVGAGTTYVAGGTGGSKDAIVVAHTHTGTTNSGGSHTHGVSDPGHSHTAALQGSANPGGGYPGFDGSGDSINAGSTGASGTGISINAGGDHTHGFTTSSSGSSGTNANLPPYLGMHFIIKH